ncbi:MAG: pantoate--beta-alanine ligase [Candidatus Nanopelagicales bacterium]
MIIIRDIEELETIPHPIGFVPTMGALHEGHLELVKRARADIGSGSVVVSIFVNPRQFSDKSDFDTYPSTIEEDLQLLEAEGVDAVFLPTVDVMYPEDLELPEFDLGNIADILEGEDRPGHFYGVAAAVYRLFDLTRPDAAYFGQKDYQQLVIVKKLQETYFEDIEIRSVKTVRSNSGLALSSRNVRLSESGIILAQEIYKIMRETKRAIESGVDVKTSLNQAEASFRNKGISVEYVKAMNASLDEEYSSGSGRLLIAVVIENVRLIDNIELSRT